jgi:hypothetical protein
MALVYMRRPPLVFTSAPAVPTFQASTLDTVNRTTYSFADQPLGSSPHVIVGVAGHDNATVFSISSGTIGGQAATIIPTGGLNNGENCIAFMIAAVNAATGTVAVTFSEEIVGCGIGTWSVTGLQSTTPTATAQDTTFTGSDLSASLTIPASGFGLGLAGARNNAGATWSWANLTLAFNQDFDVDDIFSGASSVTAGTATRTATASAGPGSDPVMQLAAWR